MAEHTRWVCAKVLGLSDIEIGELASLGALELREESNA
jgi:hypothetical protein